MPKSNNPRRYTAPERVFHRVGGVLGIPLDSINRQHSSDHERTGGSLVQAPPGSYDIGTRKINAVLNEYTESERRAIRDFLQRLLQDSTDAAESEFENQE